MLYYLNKWLFILTARSLVKNFKSGVSKRRNKTLSGRAEKISKYLVRYLSAVNEAIEYPSYKLLDTQNPNLYISRIPKDIRDKCEQFCESAFKAEGEEIDPEVLIFYDINENEDAINPNTFIEDAHKAVDKLIDKEIIDGDIQQG